MAANNSLETLDGLFKQRYAKQMERLIPDGTVLLKRIPFVSRERMQGGNYNQPVVLN